MPWRLPEDIALERIEEAKRHRSRELDLSHLGLETLPPEIGRLTTLNTLRLAANHLTSLPAQVWRLTNLTWLDLSGNQLTSLPPEIGQLTKLTWLDLDANQLTSLPPEIGCLTNLTELYLDGNHLTSLPPEIGRLTNLTQLYLPRNQLTSLPPEIGRLTNLPTLWLHGNQLTSLPPEIGRLTNLTRLYLHDNQLTSLPPELADIENLSLLMLKGNPLPDALMAAHGRGLDDLRAYLKSLKAAGEPLFEAKLILVGEGAVGKTTLLAAMLGEPPPEEYETTYGIDIRRLELPHPDPQVGRDITLNAWDFGGQRVYRITHQFFFSRRSLYLLLWRPRMGPDQCDLEGWLKMIRLRVGAEARVIIVATHCESDEHLAQIDQEVLRETYGEMIVDFHEVDSLVPADDGGGEMVGVAELKTKVARAAARLPQMGDPFNPDWKAARDDLLALEQPRISFHEFTETCAGHGLDAPATGTLADLMHDLGHVVYYGDDEGLRDEVILRPEWLSKAIGSVLEDPETNDRKGVLEHGRLRGIWYDHGIEGRLRYPPDLHPFFLRLMEKYDVSYRLEDEPGSLVAQLVTDVRPALPWLPGDAVPPGQAEIALVCRMEEVPEGLVPWMTVRTHRFWLPRHLHWQRGMFLEYPPHGTAMLELRGREFVATVRAAWPNYFMDILHHTLEQLIRERWPGLDWTLSVPCPCEAEPGRPCPGRFPLGTLHKLKPRTREVPCITCAEISLIDELLTGFKPPDWDVRLQLDEVLAKLDIASTERASYASQAAHWARRLLLTLATESRDCPRMFTLLPEDLGRLNPANFGKQGKRLTLWCEMPGDEHPVVPIGSGEPGEYVFKESREWLVKIAPYASLVARTLKTLVPLGGGALKAMLDESLLKEIAPALDLMDTATETMLAGELDAERGLTDEPDRLVTTAEGAGLRALHALLLDLDKAKGWGGLRRVPTKSGEFLWLCPAHYKEFDPGLPILPPSHA